MGFIPSPILYGLIIELDPRGEESNKGILMIQIVSLLGFVFTALTLYFKWGAIKIEYKRRKAPKRSSSFSILESKIAPHETLLNIYNFSIKSEQNGR